MLLYLQSAVVMMDSLILLSTSHTHKYNNNTANITTVQNVWFAQA